MTEEVTAPIVETRRIEDIIIGDRFRKDLGDIDSLARTIDETGLLLPVGITPDNKLIFGARRIAAYKHSGRTEIPVIIIPLEDIIKGELIENTARKDFTFSERQAILQEIEARRIGHIVSKKKVSNLQTFQKDNKGKASVNIAAEYTGVSPRQLSNTRLLWSEKEKVREIIRGLKENILKVCDAIEPGNNNVIVPFEVIINALKSDKAQDMTVAYRLFSYLSLLPIINLEKRPKIVFRKKR